MGKPFYFFAFLLITLAFTALGEPFSPDDYQLSSGGKEEMVSVEVENGTGITLQIGKYYKAGDLGARDSVILNSRVWNGAWAYGGVCAAEDIDGDGLAEIFVASYPDSTKLRIRALKPNPATPGLSGGLMLQDSAMLDLSDIKPFRSGRVATPIILRIADFDGDGQRDLGVVYWGKPSATDSLRLVLRLVTVDDSLNLADRGASLGPAIKLTHPPVGTEGDAVAYTATAADLSGSGKSSMVIVATSGAGQTADGFTFYKYSFSAAVDSFVLDTQQQIYNSVLTDSVMCVTITAGHFFGTQKDAVVAAIYSEVLDTMIAISVSGSNAIQTAGIVLPTQALPQKIADINGDGLKEFIVYPYNNPLEIYRLSPSLKLVSKGTVAGVGFLQGIGNLVPDTGAETRIEFLQNYNTGAPNYQSRMQVLSLKLDADTNAVGLDTVGNYPAYSYSTPEFGDLDGDVRLGAPRQFQVSQIVQPMVILNAPPIHFDVFGTDTCDVSKAYNNNTCQFSANYTKTSSTTTEVQTTFNKDWGVSASLSTDHSFWIAKVKSHFTAKYGEKFSKDSGASHTVTVSISIDAKEDDRIYATVMDYKVWEYPIFVNNEKKGNILVVDPSITENRWFPSKSWSGYSYQPTHEVGNILSYREYADFSLNPLLDESIKGDASSSFTLDANSSIDWSLGFSDFTNASATTEKNWGLEMGASVEAWGVELGVEGSYNSAEISTQTTTVSNDLNISAHLDALDMSLGEVSYRVTPYAYWARNGALVLDYAAMPEISPQGGTPTWWQDKYGSLADPSFILPWRYDPEKGFTLGDITKRQQTKDIQFFPREVIAGDTVTITANVSNFSLKQTAAPVTVRFYVGDPDNGGVLITGVDGRDSLLTPSIIAARGMQSVTFRWKIPSSVPQYARIYAVLDPANRIAEIHENNNKGWNILGKTDGSPIAVMRGQNSNQIDYLLNSRGYRARMITFGLPQKAQVTIDLVDFSGRKVGTLADGLYERGSHTVFLQRTLGAGVYVCLMKASTMEGKKVTLSRQMQFLE